jgi:hypothetical protein
MASSNPHFFTPYFKLGFILKIIRWIPAVLIILVLSCIAEPEAPVYKEKYNDLALRNFGRDIAKKVRERNFNSLYKCISVDYIKNELSQEYALKYLEREALKTEFGGAFRIGKSLTDFIIEDGSFEFKSVYKLERKTFLRFRAYQNFMHDIIDFEIDLTGDSIQLIDGYSYLLDQSYSEYIKELLFDNWGRDQSGHYDFDRQVWTKGIMRFNMIAGNQYFKGNYEAAKRTLDKIEEKEKYRGYIKRTEINILPYLPEIDQVTLIKKYLQQSTNETSTAIYQSMFIAASTNEKKLKTAYQLLKKQLPNDRITLTLNALAAYKLGDYDMTQVYCDSVLKIYTELSEMRLLRLMAAQNLNVGISDTIANMRLDSYDFNDMSTHDFQLAITLSNDF